MAAFLQMLSTLPGAGGANGPGPGFAVLWLALLWLLAVLVAATMTGRRRRRGLAPALASGVPILGLLTYAWGPMIGFAGLVLGMMALVFLLRSLSMPEGEAGQP